MNDTLTHQIMEKIAFKERYRLVRTLKISLPVLFFLSLCVVVTTHRTILRLIEKDAFTFVINLERGVDGSSLRLSEIGKSLKEEATEGVLAISLISGLGFIVLAKKTITVGHPRRFTQIRKYLS